MGADVLWFSDLPSTFEDRRSPSGIKFSRVPWGRPSEKPLSEGLFSDLDDWTVLFSGHKISDKSCSIIKSLRRVDRSVAA